MAAAILLTNDGGRGGIGQHKTTETGTGGSGTKLYGTCTGGNGTLTSRAVTGSTELVLVKAGRRWTGLIKGPYTLVKRKGKKLVEMTQMDPYWTGTATTGTKEKKTLQIFQIDNFSFLTFLLYISHFHFEFDVVSYNISFFKARLF